MAVRPMDPSWVIVVDSNNTNFGRLVALSFTISGPGFSRHHFSLGGTFARIF